MKRYIFSPLAREDFQDIHDYIAAQDPDTALDFVTRLELACEKLANLPQIGRSREELAAGLRSFPVARHLIFYRIIDDGVEIVRILHGAQNIKRIFASENE
ncbi:MAG: type II toxin-antitoxin system RelE/ParE family toxin [Blastocatellia bacterium]|nr:type II toxin-antitoxin system RelE/ParE family toxin [Blastocatellia bacterium]